MYAEYSAKTVAEGAISYYINNYVSSRLSRFAIGVIGSVLYDPRDPAHVTRSSSTVCRQDGTAILQGAFLVILRKVCSTSSPFLYYHLNVTMDLIREYL